MSTVYPGGIITKNSVAPTFPYENAAASGVWTLDQAMQYKRQGVWPTVGVPANFIGVTRTSVAGGGFANFFGLVVSSNNTLYYTGETRNNSSWSGSGQPYVLARRSGSFVWNKSMIRPTMNGNTCYFYDVKLNSAESMVFVCGNTISTTSSAFCGTIYRLDTSGNTVWKRSFGTPGSGFDAVQQFSSIAVNSSTSVYAAGTDPNSYDYNVVGVDSNGNFISAYALRGGVSRRYQVGNVVFDSSGALYLAGYYSDLSVNRPILIKINTSTNSIVWQKSWTNASNNLNMGRVALDSSGNPIFTIIGGVNTRVLKINPSTGAITAQVNLSNCSLGNISVDTATNDVYLAGNTTGTGGLPAYVKLNSSLSVQYARTVNVLDSTGSSLASSINAITAFKNNLAMVVGFPFQVVVPNDGSQSGVYQPTNSGFTYTFIFGTTTVSTYSETISEFSVTHTYSTTGVVADDTNIADTTDSVSMTNTVLII